MALTDGLYKVTFQTPIGTGYGVITLENGTLQGGDSSMYYVGTYVQNGNAFTAAVMAKTHTNVPGMGSVFGVPEVAINLTGTSTDKTASVTGSSPQAPGLGFSATLERLH